MAHMGRGKRWTAILDEEHAAFIQGGVSVVIATRSAELVPAVARGCGCRVSADRRRVTVLLNPAEAGSLLANVAANGMMAVVFSQPSTHRTIQLKGTDARVARATTADRLIAARHAEAWVSDLTSIGYGTDLARAIHGPAEGGLVAITMTPSAAFQQTPGPGAGAVLRS
jgi:hypothetical protein